MLNGRKKDWRKAFRKALGTLDDIHAKWRSKSPVKLAGWTPFTAADVEAFRGRVEALTTCHDLPMNAARDMGDLVAKILTRDRCLNVLLEELRDWRLLLAAMCHQSGGSFRIRQRILTQLDRDATVELVREDRRDGIVFRVRTAKTAGLVADYIIMDDVAAGGEAHGPGGPDTGPAVGTAESTGHEGSSQGGTADASEQHDPGQGPAMPGV